MGKSVDRAPDSGTSLKSNDHTPHGGAPKASKALPLSILYTEKVSALSPRVDMTKF